MRFASLAAGVAALAGSIFATSAQGGPSGSVFSHAVLHAGTQADVHTVAQAGPNWRYRYHQGRWWYYTPQNAWMIHGNNGWVGYGTPGYYGYYPRGWNNGYANRGYYAGRGYYGNQYRYGTGYRGGYYGNPYRGRDSYAAPYRYGVGYRGYNGPGVGSSIGVGAPGIGVRPGVGVGRRGVGIGF